MFHELQVSHFRVHPPNQPSPGRGQVLVMDGWMMPLVAAENNDELVL
jgi:hypothetical protein